MLCNRLDNSMKQIPSEIKILYDALLVKRGVLLEEQEPERATAEADISTASIFYEIKNTEQDKIATLNNKKENITTKKPVLKLISADWRPVYKNLESEIKLRHYSPKTLVAYRGWAIRFQAFTGSKDGIPIFQSFKYLITH